MFDIQEQVFFCEQHTTKRKVKWEKCIQIVSNCFTSRIAAGAGSAAGTLSPALQRAKAYSEIKSLYSLQINARYTQIKTYLAGDTAFSSTGLSVCSEMGVSVSTGPDFLLHCGELLMLVFAPKGLKFGSSNLSNSNE